jgi:CRP-like cAMP-binding protein
MVAIDEKYDAALKALVPINGLSPEYRQQILAQAALVKVGRGDYVFKEGDRDPFSFYLLEGEIELSSQDQYVKRVVGRTEDARHPLSQLQPRQLSARASKPSSVLRLDRALLDRLLAIDGAADTRQSVEVTDLSSDTDTDWMTRMLQSELFARVPAANIQRVFTKMERVELGAGDVVIRQGAPGDYYYVIQSGRCEINRANTPGKPPIKLAEIGPGDAFGEEALVADSHRNASVVMLTDGELRRLTKEDFIELIKNPLLNELDYERAQALVRDGAVWLDVRFAQEYEKASLPGALNVPLNVLRLQTDKLDPAQTYITFCDSGSRSAIAAFLLAERGFETHHLSGGLAAHGLLTELPKAEAQAAAARVGAPAAPAPRPAKAAVLPFPPNGTSPAVSERPAEPVAEPPNDTTFDADVRAQALKADLARASMQLEEARLLKEQAEAAQREAESRARQERERLLAEVHKAADEKLASQQAVKAALEVERVRLRELARQAQENAKAAEEAARAQLEQERSRLAEEARKAEQQRRATEEAMEARLRQEREQLALETERARHTFEEAQRLKQELEIAREEADAEARRRHEAQEQRIRAMQAEAERRMREEEQRLERTYAWQAEELAKLQKQKEEAEAKLAQERARLAQESADALQRLVEARRIQREVEATKDQAAREAEQRHQRQLELERRLREEAQAKIQEERRKLEAEFARNAEELERARREKEAAEAARAAAAEEAERIIAEYKASHAELRRREEEQLALERKRLEQEAAQIKAALQEANRAREAAMLDQCKVEEQMALLKRLQHETRDRGSAQARELASDIAAIERNVAEARANVAAAERAQQAVEAAHQVHLKSMDEQRVAEEVARSRFEEEVSEWLSEQAQIESTDEHQQLLAHQREHLQRIKRRAQEARKAAKRHDQTLIDELAAQLRDH